MFNVLHIFVALAFFLPSHFSNSSEAATLANNTLHHRTINIQTTPDHLALIETNFETNSTESEAATNHTPATLLSLQIQSAPSIKQLQSRFNFYIDTHYRLLHYLSLLSISPPVL